MLRTVILSAGALLLACFQGHAATVRQEPAPDDTPIERVEKWPKLKGSAGAAAKKDVERLRKATTDEMGAEAETALIEAGAGVAPLLLKALPHEEGNPDATERILRVLDAVTGAEHTRVLAKDFSHKSTVVRAWTLRRAALFCDAGVRTEAQKAFDRVMKQEEPDDDEVYGAALCLTSAGATAGLGELHAAGKKSWKKYGAEIRAACEAVRGPEASEAVAAIMEGQDRAGTVAALNLLAGCGSAEARPLIRAQLNSDDNSIRVAAINAARGVVDGAPPLENLPVFDAITMADEWKSKL